MPCPNSGETVLLKRGFRLRFDFTQRVTDSVRHNVGFEAHLLELPRNAEWINDEGVASDFTVQVVKRWENKDGE